MGERRREEKGEREIVFAGRVMRVFSVVSDEAGRKNTVFIERWAPLLCRCVGWGLS